MVQLETIFSKQTTVGKRDNLSSHDVREMIKFTSGGVSYLVPIEWVREVAEEIKIIIYPVPVPGHLGITNLRGEIVPVLSLPESLHDHDNRMIIMEYEDGAPFCLRASNLKKVSLPLELCAASEAVKVDGQAAAFFDPHKFGIATKEPV
jgi:chemotaxis signal transduction protein